MKISYIITTYNRADTLLAHISMIPKSDGDEIEIIVADDGSNDKTKDLCRDLLLDQTIDGYANTESYDKATPSKARNMGIELAKGDLLIFADDDCLPHKDLIRHFKKLEKGRVGVGYKKGDKAILEIDSDNIKAVEESLEGMAATLYFQRYMRGDFGHGHFTSGSFAVWKDDLGETRFDEDFVGYGYEDKHFGYLLRNAGLKFDYIIQAISYHSHETFNRPREQKNAEALKNKELLNEKIRP